MKQTKIIEPIIYTALWILCVIILVLLVKYQPLREANPHTTSFMHFFLVTVGTLVMMAWMTYLLVGWLHVIGKWCERDETRDMKKYINNIIEYKTVEMRAKKDEIAYYRGELEKR